MSNLVETRKKERAKLEEVLTQADVESYLDPGVTFEEKDSGLRTSCPQHPNSPGNDGFWIDLESLGWHCHVSNEKHDHGQKGRVSQIAHLVGSDDIDDDLIERIMDDLGMDYGPRNYNPVSDDSKSNPADDRPRSDTIFKVRKHFELRWHECLMTQLQSEEHNDCKELLLEKKKLPLSVLSDYRRGVGHCPSDFDPYKEAKALVSKGIIDAKYVNKSDPQNDILRAIGITNKGGYLAKAFSNRLIFSHKNADNNIVYFIGRRLDPTDPDKYLNQTLNGSSIDKAFVSNTYWRDPAYKIGSKIPLTSKPKGIVVVESVLDAMIMNELSHLPLEDGGLENKYVAIAAGSSGLSFKSANELADELIRKQIGFVEVIFIADNDSNKAGMKGALRSLENFNRAYQAKAKEAKAPEVFTKMGMLRKSPDDPKIDVGDHYAADRKFEIQHAVFSSQNQDYWYGYLNKSLGRFRKGDSSKFDAEIIVNELIFEGKYYLFEDDIYYEYRDGGYKESEVEIHEAIKRKIYRGLSHSVINDVKNYIKDTNLMIYEYDNIQKRNVFRGIGDIKDYNKPESMAVNNGMLDMDLAFVDPSKALTPISPYNFVKSPPPIDFNVEAMLEVLNGEYKKWPEYKFFRQIIMCSDKCSHDCTLEDEGMHHPDHWELFLQAIGSILIPHTAFKKFFIVTGGPDAGKSCAFEMIEELFGGQPYATSVSIVDIEDSRFGLAGLDVSWVNIAPEIPKTEIKESNKTKAMTGGEAVTFENKGVDQKSIKPRVSMFMIGNWLPKFRDKTEPFLNRIAIIHCINKFPKNPAIKDKYIKSRLSRERLFCLMLLGRKSLLDNESQFAEPPRHIAQKESYQLTGAPIGVFSNFNLIYDPAKEDDSEWMPPSKTFKKFLKEFIRIELEVSRLPREYKQILADALAMPYETKNLKHGVHKIYGIQFREDAWEWVAEHKSEMFSNLIEDNRAKEMEAVEEMIANYLVSDEDVVRLEGSVKPAEKAAISDESDGIPGFVKGPTPIDQLTKARILKVSELPEGSSKIDECAYIPAEFGIDTAEKYNELVPEEIKEYIEMRLANAF